MGWIGIGIGYLLGPTLRAPYGANNDYDLLYFFLSFLFILMLKIITRMKMMAMMIILMIYIHLSEYREPTETAQRGARQCHLQGKANSLPMMFWYLVLAL